MCRFRSRALIHPGSATPVSGHANRRTGHFSEHRIPSRTESSALSRELKRPDGGIRIPRGWAGDPGPCHFLERGRLPQGVERRCAAPQLQFAPAEFLVPWLESLPGYSSLTYLTPTLAFLILSMKVTKVPGEIFPRTIFHTS